MLNRLILSIFLMSCGRNYSDKEELLEYRDTVHYKGDVYTVIGYYTRDSVEAGTWINFMNGDTSNIEHYQNGMLEGKSISYYPNGQISSTTFYVEGKQHGVNRTYDYEGNIVREVFINNGTINQAKTKTYKEWQPDGSSTTIFVGDSAGYYQWENGKKFYIRDLTDEEINRWENENERIQSRN